MKCLIILWRVKEIANDFFPLLFKVGKPRDLIKKKEEMKIK